MKKTFVFLLHLGYWLIYLLLLWVIFSIISIQFRKTSALSSVLLLSPIGITCVLPNLLAFYFSYFVLFPKFLMRKKIPALVFFGILTCFVCALLCSLVLLVFFGFDQPVFTDPYEFSGLVIWMFLVACIHGGISLVIRGFIAWYDEIKLKEELYKKNYEMELALIKSQINPHFLFNTINNIDVLISKDAARASEYLNKLSGVLRYMVYETKTGKISLAKELSYIEKYIELQKIRTANPDYVKYEITGEAGNLHIAPMIFFPFIENAFKHTENNKNSNTIKIKFLIEKSRILFECENTYQKSLERKSDYGGLGNELICRRLTLLYPASRLPEIVDDGGIYKVKLSLGLYEH